MILKFEIYAMKFTRIFLNQNLRGKNCARKENEMQQNLDEVLGENADKSEGPKYPSIVVDLGDLNGPKGNAFYILGAVRKALEKGGVSQGEIDAWFADATSSSYEHLKDVCKAWVTVIAVE